MKVLKLILFFSLCCFTAFGQTEISGTVVNNKQKPIALASIYLKGTYDGSTTNNKGEFNFSTKEEGIRTLVISVLGYETKEIEKDVNTFNNIQIVLKESVNELNAVVISAGTFSAGDQSKTTTLKPMDIVTTAGSLADPIAAFQTMPGTSTVAEDGRLFVRGGRAEETQVFIDGIRVFTPYLTTLNNVPTRGRYSPFLFKGMSFSTGGYSAEFGQALSGVLQMNTIDEPENERTDISLMSVGLGVGNSQIWEKSSLTVNASYFNLGPYLEIYSDRNDWKKPYEFFSGEAVYRYKTRKGLWKLYSAFDVVDFDVVQPNINFPSGVSNDINTKNGYINTSYKHKINKHWSTFYGMSYTLAKGDFNINDFNVDNTEKSAHIKAKAIYKLGSFYNLNFGLESFHQDFDERYTEHNSTFNYGFNNNLTAIYQESNFRFSRKFALQVGGRLGYNDLQDKLQADQRFSMAYKLGQHGQMFFATGNFHQNPIQDVFKYDHNLLPEKARHFILNYQYNHSGKIFRVEAYHKKYDDLIKYNTETPEFNSVYNNNGEGLAKGIDVFWRDNNGIKNLDYWFSYSFIDSKRNFQNYSTSAQPNFVNKHNASLVTKYWVEKWKSQIGFTYNFASGRTYTNRNTNQFLGSKTKDFHSLNMNWAYLISSQKILFFSVSNILGTKNVSGYNYANTPNNNGVFEREAVRPNADRFFFIGFFRTISKKKTNNQLDQL